MLVHAGWQTVYGKVESAQGQEEESVLVAVTPGETVLAQEVAVVAGKTRPPARYNESTLLSAMEGAGKLVEDEELRAAMSAKGWVRLLRVPPS